jgi:hypothetical protein
VRVANLAVGTLLLAVAAVVVSDGVRLGFGWGSDGPRPGFFVFYLGLAMGICCLVVLSQALVRGGGATGRRPFVEPGQWKPVATVLVPAILMVVATHLVGLYVAGGVYLGAYMRTVGRHSWLLTVALAIGVPVVTFLIFEIWFLVPMPKGPLEAALGY